MQLLSLALREVLPPHWLDERYASFPAERVFLSADVPNRGEVQQWGEHEVMGTQKPVKPFLPTVHGTMGRSMVGFLGRNW